MRRARPHRKALKTASLAVMMAILAMSGARSASADEVLPPAPPAHEEVLAPGASPLDNGYQGITNEGVTDQGVRNQGLRDEGAADGGKRNEGLENSGIRDQGDQPVGNQ